MNRKFKFFAAVVVLAVSAAFADRPPFDSDVVTNYYLRLSAPEAKGARVRVRLVHTLHSERPMDGWPSVIGADGFSEWIRMPRYRRKAGRPELWYQSCIFMLHPGRGKFDRFTWVDDPVRMGLEIADAPGGNVLLALPGQMVEGGVATALFDATKIGEPVKACWFADHLAALEKSLDEAGYNEIWMPQDFMVHGELRLHSWHREKSVVTRDKSLRLGINGILRRLGINCSHTFYHADRSMEPRMDREMECFVQGRSELYAPLDHGWHERSLAFWKDWRRKNLGSVEECTVVKVGDEIPMIGNFVSSPAFRNTFDSLRRRLAPELPEGTTPIPVGGVTNRPATREGRLARYLTVRALNKETVAVLRETTADVKHILGAGVRTEANLIPWYAGEGGSWQQTLYRTPDPFLLARDGALDYPELQCMTPYARPTGPMANALLGPTFVAQMRELNMRPGGRSRMMLFPCRSEPAAYGHCFMSALLNADTDFTYYHLGFRATWCEWADMPDKLKAVAKCNRMLYGAAPYIAGQKRAKADIAMTLSESVDIWRCKGVVKHDYGTSEMRGSFYALRFSGYRVDFLREHMLEDGFLDGYKVLWATMRNMNRVSQRAIVDWVKSGGTLVMTPGALVRDEADDPSGLFDAWRAEGEPNALADAECTEFDYRKRSTSAPVRVSRVGRGRIFAFGWMPGMNFCSGALRQRELFRDETPNSNPGHEILEGAQRYGIPWWMIGDEAVRAKIDAVAVKAGAKRQISLSHGNIDAGVLDEGSRAFVGFANYNLHDINGVVASFKMKRRYESVATIDGAPVTVKWNGRTAVCTFDLGDAQALLFK